MTAERPRCGKPTRSGPCGKAEGHANHCASAPAIARMRAAERGRRSRKPSVRATWTPAQARAAHVLAGLAIDRDDPYTELSDVLGACGLVPYRRGHNPAYSWGRQP